MNNSSVIEILKSFSKDEFRKFEDFSGSPYYNKNAKVIRLVTYLKGAVHHTEEEALRKEVVWRNLFGDKKFNYGVMKNIIYDLRKITDQFMSAEILIKREPENRLACLHFLTNKGLTHQLEKSIKAMRSELSKMEISDDYFKCNYMLEMIDKGNMEIFLKTGNRNFGDYSSFNRHFLSYFFINFFMANNKGLLVSAMYDKDNLNADLIKVLNFFEKDYRDNDILSMLYYYSLRLNLEDKNEELYFEVKKFIIEHYDSFDRRTRYNSCVHLLRFCSKLTLNDDTRFAEETFGIIKFMISKNVYNSDVNRFIDHSFYYMAVDIAVHFKDSAWCRFFIDTYKEKLNPVLRKNYVNLSMMLLCRTEQNFSLSLEYLSKVIPDSSLVKLTIKEYELKNYYELGYYEEIYSLIKNNKNFSVNDRTFSKQVLNSFNNLMKYLKKLLDFKLNPKKGKYNLYGLEKLLSEIQDKSIFNKSWLMNILNQTINDISV